MHRIFRTILAYINYRLKKIKGKFWESGGDNRMLNEFLSENEKGFYMDYKNLVANYENSFPISLNFLNDLEPPKDLYIEIRVLEDCGELVTTSGDILNLKKNSTLLVRKCDVEHLIKQNVVVQTK